MKEIIMRFQGRTLKFQVTYECPTYIFCECPLEPAARGFFTTGYVIANKL